MYLSNFFDYLSKEKNFSNNTKKKEREAPTQTKEKRQKRRKEE
jgi:hypothetical protein